MLLLLDGIRIRAVISRLLEVSQSASLLRVSEISERRPSSCRTSILLDISRFSCVSDREFFTLLVFTSSRATLV